MSIHARVDSNNNSGGSQELKKLKAARKKLGFTQVDVAEKVGIYPNHYARIERGEVNPSWDTLKEILKVLKIKSLSL